MSTKYTYDGEGIIRNLEIDGLAMFDGVKIGSKSAWATAFLTDEGEIKTEHSVWNVDNTIKPRGFGLPFVRQSKKINLVKNSLIFIDRSSERQPEDNGEGEQESFLFDVLGWLLVFAVVVIPIFLPIFTASFFWPVVNENVYIVGLLEGIQRVLLCCVYIYFYPKILSLTYNMKNIKNTYYKFHGAEHKAGNCYERNDALTIENIKKHSCQHLRCGSNIMGLIPVLALCFNLFLPVQSIWWRLLITVVAIPFVVIIALELNDWRMSHYKNIIAKILSFPGYLLQYITTREPDDKMIEVALASINKVLQLERINETEIIIADGVLSISDNAFENCANLVKVHMPDGVKTIGKRAFYNCVKLSEIVLPETVENIGDEASQSCKSLSEIILPNALEYIGENAFSSCNSIMKLIIESPNINISRCAFNNCKGLQEICISCNEVAFEGDYVFAGCDSLEAVSDLHGVRILPKGTFYKCPKLKNVVLPDGLETIGTYAFSGCTDLERIHIPASVKCIESNAFFNCSNLSEVTIDGEPLFGEKCFAGSLFSLPYVKIKFQNGSQYEGGLVNGEMHGEGKMEWSQGDCYDGDWDSGNRTGQGIYRFSDGCEYVGDFVNGKSHGKGKITYLNGDCYEGDWDSGSKTGQGIYRYSDGCEYVGDFVNGKKQGKGKMEWSQGDCYDGDWDSGNRTGQGIYRFSDGREYVGDFVNGELHGNGVYRYADGREYTGSFANGKFHDKGRMTYPNGDCYEGGFSNGKFYGKGKYIVCDPDENALKTFDGEWDDGEYFSGRIMFADGTYEDVEEYKSWR